MKSILPERDKLNAYQREKLIINESELDINFILTEEAEERLQKLNNLFATDIPDEENNLAGYVLKHFGRLPAEGAGGQRQAGLHDGAPDRKPCGLEGRGPVPGHHGGLCPGLQGGPRGGGPLRAPGEAG